MNYAMLLPLIAATLASKEPSDAAPAEVDLSEAIQPALQRIRELAEEFARSALGPKDAFDFEQKLLAATRELGRAVAEWTYNRVESSRVQDLPAHVTFEAGTYTRTGRKTPQDVATLFGKITLQRVGYRSTQKDGDPTIFPLVQQLGIVEGATPALAECAARYQAEAGATQRRTLQRLKNEHEVDWGVKKLRQVIDRVAEAMTEHCHEAQVEKLLQLLEQAWESRGRHLPVLSVGRDGITFGAPVKGGTVFEVASAGTVAVLDRRGQRLGTVYLACLPESKQGTMSARLTQLVRDVLTRWERSVPRLCYVTDAGDNESSYYDKVLRKMRHPRTGEKLQWIRVLDFYHVSERLWTMAEVLFGKGSRAGRAWARRMQKLLKKPNGIRRVLCSAAALRSRYGLEGKRRKEFDKAYNYLKKRTKFMRYAAYKHVGIPCGSGVTEAACKTIFTQRLKLSGMRWKKPGAQTILSLRELLVSGVWSEAYGRVLDGFASVGVPSCDLPEPKTPEIAA